MSTLNIKTLFLDKNSLKKFLCISVMMFLITYIHSLLKISKDALVISHLGTETISAIKIWVVLPASMVFMLAYIKLADVFSRSKLFHIMSWFFIAYFTLFAFVLYPNSKMLVVDFSGSSLAAISGLRYVLPIISSWHYSLFYLFSEMWVTIMLSISLWQTANHITSFEESKNFYPLLGFVAQFGLMAASLIAKQFSKGTDWQVSLNKSTISIIVAGVCLSACLSMLVNVVGAEVFNGSHSLGVKKQKVKMNFKDSLKLIVSSKPVLMIASLLLCYNISINLIEGVWKKSIEVFYNNNAGDIQNFMGSVNLYISILSITFAIVGIYILRVCKWLTAALITPVTFIIFGVIFFVCVIFKDSIQALTIGLSAISIAVYVGAMHNIMARSSKHTLFDSTKEMAYIPLDEEIKTKGKAAAEMIGTRLGKGSGAFIQQTLLIMFTGASLIDLAPVIAVIFVLIMLWWLYSTVSLNKIMESSNKTSE